MLVLQKTDKKMNLNWSNSSGVVGTLIDSGSILSMQVPGHTAKLMDTGGVQEKIPCYTDK